LHKIKIFKNYSIVGQLNFSRSKLFLIKRRISIFFSI